MIETSPVAWLWMLVAVLASSGAGIALARLAPWRAEAREAGVPIALGIGIAPLLLGLSAVVALWLLPGASHGAHLTVVIGTMITCGAIGLLGSNRVLPKGGLEPDHGYSARLFTFLLICLGFALLIDPVFVPLMQNDALEYAIVGRLLFETRDILNYPVLDPQVNSAGFFGPWTHPPLYPALIYLSFVLQGHAEFPGIMRFIAPWCTLAGAGLVFAVGNVVARLCGLVAASFFLTTPLLFLGAGSALIDPMPILGMALVMAGLVSVAGPGPKRGLVLGALLGAALWTHSQAILLVPLALGGILLTRDWRDWRGAAIEMGGLVAAAGALGSWPYWRNLQIFGSPISDNPLVFALDVLNWDLYFRLARGIASWPDRIQYGIFKGWFAIEAYSFVFWAMALGAVVYAVKLYRTGAVKSLLRLDFSTAPCRPLFIVMGLTLCYMGAIVATTIAGIDLMIRNERYLLILLPCVSVIAGYGTAWLSSVPINASPAVRRTARGALTTMLLAFFCVQTYTLVKYRFGSIDLSSASLFDPMSRKIEKWPPYAALAGFEADGAQSLLFTLKPADAFYRPHPRMISYLDERLVPFYRAADVQAARGHLLALGVRYVYSPDYSLPPMYNSHIQEILARADMAELLSDAGGHQVYRLIAPEDEAKNQCSIGPAVSIGPSALEWTRRWEFIFGGRKALWSLAAVPAQGVGSSRFPFFQRDWALNVLSERIPLDEFDSGNRLGEGTQLLVDLDLEGDAFASISVATTSEDGMVTNVPLGDMALTSDGGPRRFMRRLVPAPTTRDIRLTVRARGAADIRVVGGSVSLVDCAGESR